MPQSMTTMSLPYSNTVKFLPISPKPPRGMTRSLVLERPPRLPSPVLRVVFLAVSGRAVSAAFFVRLLDVCRLAEVEAAFLPLSSVFFFVPPLPRNKDFFGADFLGPSLPAGCETPASFFSCSGI